MGQGGVAGDVPVGTGRIGWDPANKASECEGNNPGKNAEAGTIEDELLKFRREIEAEEKSDT